MPLSIVGFAAVYKTGFTPKMLGLGNVTGCDKLASVQGMDLYSITGALIPMLPLVCGFL